MPTRKYAQLRQQIEKLELEAEQIRATAIKGVIEQIKSLMSEHGIGLDDIRGAITRRRGRPPGKKNKPAAATVAKGKKARKARGRPRAKAKSTAASPGKKPAAKYRSPTDRKLSWSGRGRTPNWVRAWVESGKKLEDLRVK